MQVKEIRFYSRKEVEKLEELIEKNYGVKINLKDFLVFETGKRRKVWIASKEILNLPLKKLRINSFGLYIGKIKRNDKFHPSVEFCQIIGGMAKKNVVIANKRDAERFVGGGDIELKKGINCEEHNFVLVRYKEYTLGAGRLFKGKVENLIPKSRKIISLR